MQGLNNIGQMTSEQYFMIHMLSDHLNGDKTSAPKGPFSWKRLISIAKSHEIGGILYKQCGDLIPENLKQELAGSFGFSVQQYVIRRHEEQSINSALVAEGIPHLFVKGSAVAAYYPVPALRTMGDSDLVIHREDREKADTILRQLGYYSDSKDSYRKQTLHLELHDHLIHSYSIVSKEMAEFFNDVWAYETDGKLDWSFHFLFLLVHLRGHFAGSGVGLRQFMDLAVITKNDPGLDWLWIQDRLRQFELLRFAKNVLALNEKWFSIKSPIGTADAQDSFLEEATDYILRNGVFGYMNEENRAGYLARDYADSRFPVYYMIRNACSKIFIPYHYLITMPQYAFLRGRPYLLPAMWIYRGYYTIRKKGKGFPVHSVKASFTTRDVIKKRAELLEKWGIRKSTMIDEESNM